MFHCSDQSRQPTTSCYHSLHFTTSDIQINIIVVNTREMVYFMQQSVMKKLLEYFQSKKWFLMLCLYFCAS